MKEIVRDIQQNIGSKFETVTQNSPTPVC